MLLMHLTAVVIAFTLVCVECTEDCLEIKDAVIPWPYLNVRKEGPKSEFHCKFEWKNRDHMIHKVKDRMKNRQKRFLHFKVPVQNYTNVYLSLTNYTGHVTWVWVVHSHEYMIYYPHNFLALSLGTIGIITQHFEDEDDYLGSCDQSCVGSCGLGKYELEDLLLEISAGNQEYDWEYLCLHADYETTDIVSLDERAFAIPDLLYYWKFLRMFYTRRPLLGTSDGKYDLPNYYCFGHKGIGEGKACRLKLLLQKYFVIPLLALLVWFYCPLLIHYFPSSEPVPRHSDSDKLFPSYKTPIYFGRFLRCVLCYYKQKDPESAIAKLAIKIRRLLFMILLMLPAFRLFLLPGYRSYTWFIALAIVMPSVLWPRYLSKYVQPDIPLAFPFFGYRWNYPRGLIKQNSGKMEYQLLAHVMQERIYLSVDCRFWCHLFRCSFHWFSICYTAIRSLRHSFLVTLLYTVLLPCCLVLGCAAFSLATMISFTYLFVPLPFFFKELVISVWRGSYSYVCSSRLSVAPTLGLLHGIVITCVVLGVALNLFVICYLLSEFAMFTYIGATLTPTMAFKYLTLIGAVVLGIYYMVRDLHGGYDQILNEVIATLKTPERLSKLVSDLNAKGITLSINRENDPNNSAIYGIHVHNPNHKSTAESHQYLLRSDGITVFVSKDLYFVLVEKLRPVRRQVLFLAVKFLLMLFFIVVAMWMKNVYHMESQVGHIFSLVSTLAVYFIPSALQFLAYKSHFGTKSEELLKREIHASLIAYMEELSQAQARAVTRQQSIAKKTN